MNDAKELCDVETASSSGVSHVSSQPLSVPSPRGLISRDSCLQPAARSSLSTSGHVFLNIYLLQLNHQQQSLENSTDTASASCGSVPLWIQKELRSEL